MTAALLITFAEWWLYIGAAVAAVFITIGIDRIDEDARSAYVFRPLLIPGVLLIWPIVLWRWYALETSRDQWAKRYRPDRAAHGKWWLIFGIVIPLIFVGAIILRQTRPADFEPQRIEAPREARP
jgi:hypothetical protein